MLFEGTANTDKQSGGSRCTNLYRRRPDPEAVERRDACLSRSFAPARRRKPSQSFLWQDRRRHNPSYAERARGRRGPSRLFRGRGATRHRRSTHRETARPAGGRGRLRIEKPWQSHGVGSALLNAPALPRATVTSSTFMSAAFHRTNECNTSPANSVLRSRSISTRCSVLWKIRIRHRCRSCGNGDRRL